MTHVALTADPDVPVDELTMGLWADALDKQSKEVCQTYDLDYVPVVYYKVTDALPAGSIARVAYIKTNIGTPGALGFHDLFITGVPFSEILWQGPDDTS